jgi:hypothetical protein
MPSSGTARQRAEKVVTDWIGDAYDCSCGGLTDASAESLVELIATELGVADEPAHKNADNQRLLRTRCSVHGCNRNALGRDGMCRAHNRRGGYVGPGSDLSAVQVESLSCIVPDCTQPVRARGMCRAHHAAWIAAIPKSKRGDSVKQIGNVPIPPGDPKPMAVAITQPHLIDHHRRVSCPAYNACLGWTVARGWPGFSCQGCKGPSLEQTATAQEGT